MAASPQPRKRLAAAACAILLLAGCATATPYQPIGTEGARGGFAELRIAPNRYRVTFAGNNLTSRQRVETYLLYRAAELTLEQRFDCFTIEDRATDRNVQTRVYRDPFGPGPYAFWRPWWRYRGAWGWRRWDPWFGDPFWADDIDVRTVQTFEANAEIVLSRGCRPDDRRSFNAREVIENLRPSIVYPGEER
jgi:hypothetical protein